MSAILKTGRFCWMAAAVYPKPEAPEGVFYIVSRPRMWHPVTWAVFAAGAFLAFFGVSVDLKSAAELELRAASRRQRRGRK